MQEQFDLQELLVGQIQPNCHHFSPDSSPELNSFGNFQQERGNWQAV